jgi:uncharacterized protein involved in outer membrane biogenesis
MGKVVKITLALILVVAVAVAVVVLMNLGSGLKTLIETLGPEMTQAQVSLREAEISLISGEGSLKDLVIGNPDGFDTEHAFSLGEISFKLDAESLSSDTIVVESLRILAPHIIMESGRGGSNLDRLQQNIQRYLGSSDSAPASDEGASKNIIIRDLLISDAVLEYGLLGSTAVELPLPELQLSNIGEPGQGASIAEASAKIIAEISASATRTALQSGASKDVGSKLEDQIKDRAGELKGLFKGLRK